MSNGDVVSVASDIQNHEKRGKCFDGRTQLGRFSAQFVKMICLTMVPTLCLWSYSIYSLTDSIAGVNDIRERTEAMEFSMEVGQLIHALQKERDMSILHGSALGSDSRIFLQREYDNVDAKLSVLSQWPQSLINSERTWSQSKERYSAHLMENRRRLKSSSFDIHYEMKVYTEVIDVLLHALLVSIRESKYAPVWKTLVAYQKVTTAKEDVGLERAFGTYFFVHGRFESQNDFQFYSRKLNGFQSLFGEAVRYSQDVNRLVEYKVTTLQNRNIVTVIDQFRADILYNSDTNSNGGSSSSDGGSLPKAQYFFDNMTVYMDLLLDIQKDLGNTVIQSLSNKAVNERDSMIIHAVLLTLVILLSPVMVQLIHNATTDVNRYAIALASKTKELKAEKTRSDSLLYQMLPKPVAMSLKKSEKVDAEFFESVTIFFSDIYNFGSLSSCTAVEEIIDILNTLYIEVDAVIDNHDVYKVETINDSYMVASGVPIKNGKRHVQETANFAIDVLKVMNSKYGSTLQLRVGINTGPCMAGVVGTKMPRYCLFGDTINTASRMKSHSLPNRIQLSASTFRILQRTGDFHMVHRGFIEMKGKGDMKTYWLLGRTADDVSFKTERAYSIEEREEIELPGEITYQPTPSYFIRQTLKSLKGCLEGDTLDVNSSKIIPDSSLNGEPSNPGVFTEDMGPKDSERTQLVEIRPPTTGQNPATVPPTTDDLSTQNANAGISVQGYADEIGSGDSNETGRDEIRFPEPGQDSAAVTRECCTETTPTTDGLSTQNANAGVSDQGSADTSRYK